MPSPKLQILGRFLSVFGSSPLRTSKYLTTALFHQITTIVEQPEQIRSLTDSQRAQAWEKTVNGIVSHNKPLQVSPHDLPSPLIVSLTSYRRRFSRLHLTLRCLLAQTMRPDRLLLWVSHEDNNHLTPEILELREAGLEICASEDMGPFTKIIPTMQAHPGHFVVTADDDLYYWPTWLEELVTAWSGRTSDIVAHRVHRIRLDQQGLPLPYHQWSLDDPATTESSTLNFATGVGGVFYPPGTLHPDVTNVEAFRRLCGKADDVWLYWMARMNGSIARRTKSNRRVLLWPDTQGTALFKNNVAQGNDEFIKAMIAEYGFPATQVGDG